LRFLLDTNAISELGKPRPDPGFMAWHDQQAETADRQEGIFLSVLLLGEMDRGILTLPESPKRAELSKRRDLILSVYRKRILPVDVDVARRWGAVSDAHRRQGLTPGVIDELIAATALAYDLTLVTRNVRHFEHSGCRLLSPWSG